MDKFMPAVNLNDNFLRMFYLHFFLSFMRAVSFVAESWIYCFRNSGAALVYNVY